MDNYSSRQPWKNRRVCIATSFSGVALATIFFIRQVSPQELIHCHKVFLCQAFSPRVQISVQGILWRDTQSIMAQYQLFYFPLRGRGQATRYLFEDNGIKYEEINTGNNWVKDFKPKMPFGQAPMLRDGDFDIAQSNSIIRYLGRKHGLYPEDAKEAAKVDMITDHVEDIRGPYVKMIYQNYEAGKDDFVKSLSEKLQYIENLFKAWGNDYIVSKISFADYNLLDLLDDLVILSPTCLDAFPTVKAYYNRMTTRPALKKYRDTDQFKKMPVNGNEKQ